MSKHVLIFAILSICRAADVLVYGSSPAGIAAATAAGQLGMHVILIEPLPMIGGMGAAGNLALNDGGMKAERTGLAKVFTLLNGKHYGLDTEVPHPESFVSEASFYTMLKNANVTDVRVDCRMLSARSETKTIKGKKSFWNQGRNSIVLIESHICNSIH